MKFRKKPVEEKQMSRVNLVTITGADNSIDPGDLLALSKKYPFVEWGILFGSHTGPRFPTEQWLRRLPRDLRLRLSAHLCGCWVRDLVLNGHFSWLNEYRFVSDMFARVQLNFHGQFHRQNPSFKKVVLDGVKASIILQCDGVNDATAKTLCAENPRFVPLFDRSGGAGILPNSWPESWKGVYSGYAGGLGPDNILEQLDKIDHVAGPSYWVDMERRVRSEDDSLFDLSKITKVLDRVAGGL